MNHAGLNAHNAFVIYHEPHSHALSMKHSLTAVIVIVALWKVGHCAVQQGRQAHPGVHSESRWPGCPQCLCHLQLLPQLHQSPLCW